VNNQIGFTTAPADARSTTYCTDVAKMIQVPIFHVNAEDPEAAVYVAELALDFRQAFQRDVVIDMFCYRRHGHNEGDEPSFTQPLMYRKIAERPSSAELYHEKLVQRGTPTESKPEETHQNFKPKSQPAREEGRPEPQPPQVRAFAGRWKGLTPRYVHTPVATGVPFER